MVLFITLVLSLALNVAAAFTVVGLPMVLFHAPTWAWFGCTMVAVYASVDSLDS